MVLKVEYDQGKDQRWSTNQETRNGACHALSIHWILNQAKGSDFFNWLKTDQEILDKVVRIMQQQQKASAKGGLEQDENSKLPRGLTFKMAWVRHKIEGNSTLKMKSEYETAWTGGLKGMQGLGIPINPAKGSENGVFYNYIAFSLKAAGSHAIATTFKKNDKNRSEIKVFDPNYGEYHCKDLSEYFSDMKEIILKEYEPRSMWVISFS